MVNIYQIKKLTFPSLLALSVTFLSSINTAHSETHPPECENLKASVTFIESTGVVCLQNIKVSDASGTAFYKAALRWLGADRPNQYSLVSVEGDVETENNSPVFSPESGVLTLPQVDIPKTFGTERYTATLTLHESANGNYFELDDADVYNDPNYVPNKTWKPYAMLNPTERRNINLLGQSIPFAGLANSIYDFDTVLDNSWVLLDERDTKSGMQAGVYRNSNTGELVLAFRGTEAYDCEWSSFFSCAVDAVKESALDIAADALLNFGTNGPQFRDAYDYAQEVFEYFPDQPITITGHSLGGGLAQAIGSAFGMETFAFNSAPVPNDFMEDHPSVLLPEELDDYIHVIGDIHDPVSNTNESGKFYLNASHISSLVQFDFDEMESLPNPLAELDALRFNKHGLVTFIDNANELLDIYRGGW